MNNISEYIHKHSSDIESEIIFYRRQIHQNPELSFNEYKTSTFIKQKLSEIGVNFSTIAETGVVGLIGKGKRCVALRADIDALPIQEETGLTFSSKNDGIMHACGHDMHTAMLLGAATILKSIENEISGTVKLIFQPAEEKLPGGAKILIEQAVLESPSPEAIFGQHVNPELNTGLVSIASGPIMGSADELYWTIRGKGTHAAQPQLGNDVITAQANLILSLQNVLNKTKNPIINSLLSITSVNGGSATNIMPDEVKLMGTLRSFDNDWRLQFHNVLESKSREICQVYDTDCKINIIKGYPPLINNDTLTEDFRNFASELIGVNNIVEFEPKMWAEDFAYYSQVIPACFWFLGVKSSEANEFVSLHNSRFSPDENALKLGAALLAFSAFQYLNKA